MMKHVYIIVTILILTACAAPAQRRNQEYFPPSVLESQSDFNTFAAGWYSGHLRVLNEEPLPPKTRDKRNEIYRFTCLRTFHNPFSIRINVVNGGKGILIRKFTSGRGGYETGSLQETQSIELSRAAIERLSDFMDSIRFWNLPTTIDVYGADGSQWIVEAVKNGKYHVVDRWTPYPGTDIRTLGECFLSLAEWKPDELY
jgi:hypothetical protein